MANNIQQALREAYCHKFVQQTRQQLHTFAHLQEMAQIHSTLCERGEPGLSLTDASYLGILDAISALQKEEASNGE